MVNVAQVNDMIITVDRIEEEKIVFITDDDKQFLVDKKIFPTLKEGDIINANVDYDLTKSKKEEVKNRLNNLFNR